MNAKPALDFKVTCILLHIILKTDESGNHHCGCTVQISHRHSCMRDTTTLNEVHTTLQIQRRKSKEMQKEKNHSQPDLRGILQRTTSTYQFLLTK